MFILLLLCLLLPGLAFPLSSPSSDNDTQIWTITRLDYHYMTEYPGFGPPHMPWPASAIFDTTLSFDISIPDVDAPDGDRNETCELSWAHTTSPATFVACRGLNEDNGEREGMQMGGVYFGVDKWNTTSEGDPPDVAVDMPFNLKMWRVDSDSESNTRQMYGNIAVSCDDPSSPTSYLTCLTGKPLDGMRCKLHGINNIDLSNHKELQVVAQRCNLPGQC